jgi:hypothetical protein
MFPTQVNACYCLLHPHHPDHLAVIHRTGAGKTHILLMLGVVERGIILIVIPLLTLLTNVIHKFKCTNKQWGSVVVHHLNEIYDLNKRTYKQLLHFCKRQKWNTTSTIFVFLLPQFLVQHPAAHDVFVRCSQDTSNLPTTCWT